MGNVEQICQERGRPRPRLTNQRFDAGEAVRAPGFTLIEILVVIAIMAILAGLTVGLVSIVGDRKRVSMTTARVQHLATLIETYKAKKGHYPPDNPDNFSDPTNTSLFYELVGAARSANQFVTPFGNVAAPTLKAACGVDGILNSTTGAGGDEDRANVLRLITTIRPDETNSIVVNGGRIVVFVGPEGPNGRTVNPFYYRIGAPNNGAHNPSGFDLWTVIKSRSGAKVIGNWKD